tara:strand:+ start:367 stop:741 length:375 start_codon:yes stop_codon:yes gene_type:complete
METHNDIDRQPKLAEARRRSGMAHRILVRLKEKGLPEDMDQELSMLCTDLADIWGAHTILTENLKTFIESDEDSWSHLGDVLVDIRSELDHMKWHINSIEEPIHRIVERAYELEAQNNVTEDFE